MIFPFLHWFVYPRSSDGSSRIVLIRMLFGKELYRREFVVKEIAQENRTGTGTKADERKERLLSNLLGFEI